jgi:hypothetical protein
LRRQIGGRPERDRNPQKQWQSPPSWTWHHKPVLHLSGALGKLFGEEIALIPNSNGYAINAKMNDA